MPTILEKFGVISICILGFQLTRMMSKHLQFLSMARSYKKRKLKDLGHWAVVVGADERLGQTYSIELAKQGLHVVLIGRDFSKLSKMSNLLEKYFQIFTGVLSLSFHQNEFTYLEKALKNLDIAVLINAPCYSFESENKQNQRQELSQFDYALSSIVSRNITIVTKMCAIVIPGMASKRKGIVVNVCSVSLKTSRPLQALYEASAAYIEKLTEELRKEYSSSGVLVQTLLPGYDSVERPKMTKQWMMLMSKDCFSVPKRSSVTRNTPKSVVDRIRGLCPRVQVLRRIMESVQRWTSESISWRRPCFLGHLKKLGSS